MRLGQKKARPGVTPKKRGSTFRLDANSVGGASQSSIPEHVPGVGTYIPGLTPLPQRTEPVATRRGLDLLTGMAGPGRDGESVDSSITPGSRAPAKASGSMVAATTRSQSYKELEAQYWQESNKQQRDFALLESLKG